MNNFKLYFITATSLVFLLFFLSSCCCSREADCPDGNVNNGDIIPYVANDTINFQDSNGKVLKWIIKNANLGKNAYLRRSVESGCCLFCEINNSITFERNKYFSPTDSLTSIVGEIVLRKRKSCKSDFYKICRINLNGYYDYTSYELADTTINGIKNENVNVVVLANSYNYSDKITIYFDKFSKIIFAKYNSEEYMVY